MRGLFLSDSFGAVSFIIVERCSWLDDLSVTVSFLVVCRISVCMVGKWAEFLID